MPTENRVRTYTVAELERRSDPRSRRFPQASQPPSVDRDRTEREEVRGDAPNADPTADGRSEGGLPSDRRPAPDSRAVNQKHQRFQTLGTSHQEAARY